MVSKYWNGKDYNNEKNPYWKGDKVKIDGLHAWIIKHKPKSMFCEKCGKITDKLDCANISGLYKRDISDFRWLCRSCHMREDGRINNLKKGKFTNQQLNSIKLTK